MRYYFKDGPDLPILRRDGGIEWVQWGLPYGADVKGVPAGACARRESLLEGKWKRLNPRPVKIMAEAFMERDGKKQPHWFEISDRLAIQGAMIVLKNELFTGAWGSTRAIVYVVTEPAAGDVALIHDRQPRLILV